ncbi:MAG: hypothetical protein AAF078_02680 [Planctomycetota bacterium]
MPDPRPYDARPIAVALVLLSGALLLPLALILQISLYEFGKVLTAREIELPAVTELTIKLFGLYGHETLSPVVLWLWWPMVASLEYTLARYRQLIDFAIAFGYLFAGCWLLVLGLILALGTPIALGFLVMMKSMVEPPAITRWFGTVAWLLPLLTSGFIGYCVWRYRFRAPATTAARSSK